MNLGDAVALDVVLDVVEWNEIWATPNPPISVLYKYPINR